MFTVTTTAQDGTKGSTDLPTKAAALSTFFAYAEAGTTVALYSPKGNVLNGYRSEQGPVEVIDGALRAK